MSSENSNTLREISLEKGRGNSNNGAEIQEIFEINKYRKLRSPQQRQWPRQRLQEWREAGGGRD